MKPARVISLFTVALLAAFLAQFGYALGGEGNVGNGGYAYRYRDAQGVERLEMVDYWEAMHTPELEPKALPADVYPVETWVEKTHHFIESVRSKDVELAEFLLTSLERFTSPDFSMSTDPSWGPTEEPHDINAEFAPNNGSVELVVYQRDKSSSTDVEFYKTPVFWELNSTQKLVAFLHESIYRERKSIDPDSVRTRLITAYLLNGDFEEAKARLWLIIGNDDPRQQIQSFRSDSVTPRTRIPDREWGPQRQYSLLESFWRRDRWSSSLDLELETSDRGPSDTRLARELLKTLSSISPSINVVPLGFGDTGNSFGQSTFLTSSGKTAHFDRLFFYIKNGTHEHFPALSKKLKQAKAKSVALQFCMANLVQAWLTSGAMFGDFEHMDELGYSNLSRAFPLQSLKVKSIIPNNSNYTLELEGPNPIHHFTAEVRTFKGKWHTDVTDEMVLCAFDQIKVTRRVTAYSWPPDNMRLYNEFIYGYAN